MQLPPQRRLCVYKECRLQKGCESPTGEGPTAPSSGLERATVEKSDHHLRNFDLPGMKDKGL